MAKLLCAWCIALLLCTVAVAQQAAPVAEDPALEKRVARLSEELRCLVCQNQTIADSHAELAIDLKNQIREQMHLGRSDDAIMEYMVARYGDFVLYRPPVKATTAVLWFGPGLLVVGGMIGLALYLRQRRKVSGEDDGLDDETGADYHLGDDVPPPGVKP
jgi:cytochrome c-type biogenesis protein CcmH